MLRCFFGWLLAWGCPPVANACRGSGLVRLCAFAAVACTLQCCCMVVAMLFLHGRCWSVADSFRVVVFTVAVGTIVFFLQEALGESPAELSMLAHVQKVLDEHGLTMQKPP